MNLSTAPAEYDAADQRRLRAAIEAADRENYKHGRDVEVPGAALLKVSYASGITAHAGGGKASAFQLTAAINHVGTVASAADSLLLPSALAGTRVSIQNRGANAAQVFGKGTDTIDDVATATGLSQGAGKNAVYDCPVDGKWYRVLSA